ncbi:MAG: hypothetical protein ACLFPF_09460 [Halanaerobiales bacterium]
METVNPKNITGDLFEAAIVNQKAVVNSAQVLLSVVALNIFVEFEAMFGIVTQID